jgi:hypothetical protein
MKLWSPIDYRRFVCRVCACQWAEMIASSMCLRLSLSSDVRDEVRSEEALECPGCTPECFAHIMSWRRVSWRGSQARFRLYMSMFLVQLQQRVGAETEIYIAYSYRDKPDSR